MMELGDENASQTNDVELFKVNNNNWYLLYFIIRKLIKVK
jgi:hypothetical protein